jgi:hypothetical protein
MYIFNHVKCMLFGRYREAGHNTVKFLYVFCGLKMSRMGQRCYNREVVPPSKTKLEEKIMFDD